MNESQFNCRIMASLTHCDKMRVENATISGTPDINICTSGVEVWIESKIDEPLLRPAQYAWGMRRAHRGGHVFVLMYSHEHDRIFVWKYPLKAKVVGKYVRVVDGAAVVCNFRDLADILSLLVKKQTIG